MLNTLAATKRQRYTSNSYMLQVETEPNTRRGELHIRPGHAASEKANLVRLFRSAATYSDWVTD
jgi:hypothetical protein